jgi:predicted nucleic acid-binding protein
LRSFVVDASVATRFLVEEDLSGDALAVADACIAGEIDLFAPPVITYEVGNALKTAVARRVITDSQASEQFGFFLGMQLGRMSISDEDHEAILRLALGRDFSFYDGAYVWASKSSGMPLLTADNRQYSLAREIVKVIHLKDFRNP